MKKMLLPIIMLLMGLGAGAGAGLFMAPNPSETSASNDHDPHAEETAQSHATEPSDAAHADAEDGYYKFQQQFVVPVVKQGKMRRMVIMSLALVAPETLRPDLVKHEPKLRDALLRAMFDHATLGGFDGNFTENGPMAQLYERLLQASRAVVGTTVSEVLILEIARQDLD